MKWLLIMVPMATYVTSLFLMLWSYESKRKQWTNRLFIAAALSAFAFVAGGLFLVGVR